MTQRRIREEHKLQVNRQETWKLGYHPFKKPKIINIDEK
jgi:hypothetical protein